MHEQTYHGAAVAGVAGAAVAGVATAAVAGVATSGSSDYQIGVNASDLSSIAGDTAPRDAESDLSEAAAVARRLQRVAPQVRMHGSQDRSRGKSASSWLWG